MNMDPRTDILDIVRKAFRYSSDFVIRHWSRILTVLVCFLILEKAIEFVVPATARPITVYVGAPGTSNYRIKDRLADAVRGIGASPRAKYDATVVSTSGIDEVEGLLEKDPDGQAIGVTVDRIHAPELRTLLPLDWDYVHVLARVGFLNSIRTPAIGKWPADFSEVVRQLKYGRVFAGPQDSGTFDFADRLFELYKRTPNESLQDYLAPSIVNWDQARAALKAGAIDLAFYSGPIGATTVQGVADDGTAVLLGLKDVQSTLSRDNSLSLVTSAIPSNSYRASPITVPGEASPDTLAGGLRPLLFCGQDTPTLAARRLIVASKRMSTYDAYVITGALTDSLTASDDCPTNTWKRQSPGLPASDTFAELGILPHPGAELRRTNADLALWWKPATWNSFWQKLGLACLSIVATWGLHGIALRMRRAKSTVKPGDDGPQHRDAIFAELHAQIAADVDRAGKKPGQSRKDRESWLARVNKLEAHVDKLRKDRRLTDKQTEALQAGLRDLETELSNIATDAPVTKGAT